MLMCCVPCVTQKHRIFIKVATLAATVQLQDEQLWDKHTLLLAVLTSGTVWQWVLAA